MSKNKIAANILYVILAPIVVVHNLLDKITKKKC